MAPLRNQTFFSLGELREAIAPLLAALNERPFKKTEGSRRSWFEDLDRPALKPLPAERYEYAEWRKARVNLDYHIQVAHALYSVPHPLGRCEVDVRITAQTVEIFHKHRRVAAHVRVHRKGGYATDPAHMPASHRAHAGWTPSGLIAWGRKTGSHTAAFVEQLLESRPHPEQGYRSCPGLKRLLRAYGAERLEAACRRAHGPSLRGADRHARHQRAVLRADRLSLLLEREKTDQEQRRYQRLKGHAKLHLDATIEDLNFKAPRGLDRSLVLRLASGQWIRDGQTVLVSGATGSGKSYLACAFGHQACRLGISTRYYRVSRLLDELTLARGDGSYPKLVQRLARTWLLVLDDWGLASLSGQGRHDLLEVLDDRYARRGTLLASQVPVEHWHDVVGDPTFGDAILDRLLNICCGSDYGADGPDRPLGHDKRPYLRNIISYHQSATRKAISPFLSFHGRSGPDCAASQSAIAFAFISRSISA